MALIYRDSIEDTSTNSIFSMASPHLLPQMNSHGMLPNSMQTSRLDRFANDDETAACPSAEYLDVVGTTVGSRLPSSYGQNCGDTVAVCSSVESACAPSDEQRQRVCFERHSSDPGPNRDEELLDPELLAPPILRRCETATRDMLREMNYPSVPSRPRESSARQRTLARRKAAERRRAACMRQQGDLVFYSRGSHTMTAGHGEIDTGIRSCGVRGLSECFPADRREAGAGRQSPLARATEMCSLYLKSIQLED